MRRFWIPFALLLVAASAPAQEGNPRSPVDAIQTLQDEGRTDEARAAADQLRDTLTSDDLGTADILLDLAVFYREVEAPDDAIPLFERALEIRERELGEEHLDVAEALTKYSQLLLVARDSNPAIPLLTRSLAIREKLQPPAHKDWVGDINVLAQIHLYEGRLEEAEQILESALERIIEAHGKDSHLISNILANLGQIADHRQDYGKARRMYRRALDLVVQHDGGNTRSGAIHTYRIARLDYMQGNNPSADRMYSLATGRMAAALGPEHSYVGAVLMDHAAVLADMEDFEAAEEKLQAGRIILEEALPPDHPNLAALYHRIGETIRRKGGTTEAMTWLQKSLDIREEVFGLDHDQVAASLKQMVHIHRKLGETKTAKAKLQRVIDINIASRGPDHHFLAGDLFTLSQILADEGDLLRSLEVALRSESIGRAQLRSSIRDLAERTGLLYAEDRSHGAALKMLLSLAAQGLDEDGTRQVWHRLIDARGFVLDEIARRRRALRELDDPAIQKLWDDVASAAADVARLKREEPGSEAFEATRARHEDLEMELAAVSRSFDEQRRADRVSLADVESALPSGAALVAYARFQSYFEDENDVYLALVLAVDGSVRAYPLGDAGDIDALVAGWKSEASWGALRDEDQAENRYRAAATELRQRIWDPFADAVVGADWIFLVPDGALSLINFAALTAEDGYMIESPVVLHSLDAERDVYLLGDTPATGQGLLAMGNPDFDAAFDQLGAPTSDLAVSRFRGARSPCTDFRSVRFGSLPGAAVEVETVASLWSPDDRVSVLTGVDATERNLKSLAPQARVLHLATHGFFLPADCETGEIADDGTVLRGVGGLAPADSVGQGNPLSFSGVVFAGANHRSVAPPEAEDGILTAEEVAALDLSGVEWAVLSACDSGVGDIQIGEGVVGLRRAFRAAGARTLIMSLWSVADEDARQWMSALYRARFGRGASTAQSVQIASRAVFTARRDAGKSTHPFYWAGFVAGGDWR